MQPNINSYAAYARDALRRGLSANQALRELRAAGQGIRRQDWLSLYRQLDDTLKSRATGIDRPGGRRPYQREILVMSTATATGYLQYVDVWVKNRSTGEISARPYGIATDDLMTHDDAIETAVDRMQAFADDYDEVILGGTYLTTYMMVPKGR